MNKQDIIRLLGYINGLDPLTTCDAIRVDAWDDYFNTHAPNLNFFTAKNVVATHYANTTKSIRPKDIIDQQPTPAPTYTKGTKPYCPKCTIYLKWRGVPTPFHKDTRYSYGEDDTLNLHEIPAEPGYIRTPIPNSNFFYIDLCDCQWDGPPRETPNPEYITRRNHHGME